MWDIGSRITGKNGLQNLSGIGSKVKKGNGPRLEKTEEKGAGGVAVRSKTIVVLLMKKPSWKGRNLWSEMEPLHE